MKNIPLRIALTIALSPTALPAGYGQSKVAGWAPAETNLAESVTPRALSTRVVAYQIDASLDTSKHTVTATETLRYRNLTGQPQKTFPFHLYLNAFQPQSTFSTEAHRDDPDLDWEPESFGAITISHLEVTGMGDLTRQMHFIHPDDDNTADHTVMEVELPKAVPAGAEVEFKIAFNDQLPRVVARTGYIRDFFMVAQWFPKVGVWWKNAWNCHQFHADTEFFADFGTFDVKVTIPQNEIVGAGGDLVASTNNSDGTKTLTFHSEDVHDFSWSASPSFIPVEDSWTGSAGTVGIHVLMSPGHIATAPRYIQALKGTLSLYDQWIGPYPYDRLTIIDPPHGGFRAGGMEYPTLITGDTTWYMPKGALLPEDVIDHEFGHQYWYGMVATNEFEEAWLDEGINSYMEVKTMDALYGKGKSFVNFPFAQAGLQDEERASYLRQPDTDPITRFAWQFYDDSAYGSITYGKTATVLLTLENIIGEEALRQALHTYFLRYRFTHPTGEDFIKTIEEASGKDLHWYFDQAIFGTQMLDYKILDAHSDPLKWYESESQASKGSDEIYRTYVTVQRKVDFVFPVDLKVTFDDGQTVTEHWDGRDRWKRYVYDRKAQLAFAEIDPGHEVWLDRNFFNNSYVVKADSSATSKLAQIWTFAGQWLAQLLAWLT
jgi:hypothetical protein